MSFVDAYDNPRRERCIPELDTTEDDPSYWLDTMALQEEYDRIVNSNMWDEIDYVASIHMYVRIRKAAAKGIRAAATPKQVYSIIEKIPPDFFQMEDDMVLNGTYLDGNPLYKGFWTVERIAEERLKRVRISTKKRSKTIEIIKEKAPDQKVIQPILLVKGGTILRAMTMEQRDILLAKGFVAKG